jgi:MFS family permease
LSVAAAPSLGAPATGKPLARGWIFAICLVAWTLTNMDQSLFSYALPGILAEFNLPLEAAGIILTVSFLLSSVFIVFAGLAADRFGRGRTLAVLLGVSALFVGLQGFASGIVMLTLMRAMGFGLSGGLSPITNTLVVEQSSDRQRGLAMGVLQCGYPLGWLLASLVAAPLLTRYDWRAACFIAFAAVPCAALIGWLLRNEPTPPRAASGGSVATSRKAAFAVLFAPERRLSSIACIATFFLFGGAYAGSAFFFPTFFVTQRGYSPAAAASLVGWSNGIAVVGYLAAAVIGEYWLTRRTVFIVWAFGGALALLGLIWASHGTVQDVIWFAAMSALFFGAMAVLPVVVAEIFPTEVRATALAVCASAPLSLGFAIFPLVVPAVISRLGWEAGLSLVVVPAIVGAALAAVLLPNRRSGLAMA